MTDEPIVEARGLHKTFRAGSGWFGRGSEEICAAQDVSFTVRRGGSLAVIGESGSGKTTLARMLLGFERPDAGTITIDGADHTKAAARLAERKERARRIQIVFQDPYTSLDRRQTMAAAVDEVLRAHFDWPADRRRERVKELTDLVGLDERQANAYPRMLSGGQRQRVAIARALATEPSVLVLDEAVSALDVSIQAQILNLLADVRERTGMTYLFISHDLAVVRQVTEAAIVMRAGEIVERGPTATILDSPQHPYTKALRASVPRRGWKPARARAVIENLQEGQA